MSPQLALSLAATAFLSITLASNADSAERRGLSTQLPNNRVVVGPTVVYATTSVKCGSTIYEVSTGTSGGGCSVTRVPGQPTQGANCVDGGNAAEANCTTGCGTTSGSGSCTIKSAD